MLESIGDRCGYNDLALIIGQRRVHVTSDAVPPTCWLKLYQVRITGNTHIRQLLAFPGLVAKAEIPATTTRAVGHLSEETSAAHLRLLEEAISGASRLRRG